MSVPWTAMLEVEAIGCTAEFFVNEIPVQRIAPGRAAVQVDPVEHLLSAGENALAVVIHPGPRPSQFTAAGKVSKATPPPRVRAQLRQYPPGAFPGDPNGVTLTAIEWREAREEADPYATPVVRVNRFEALRQRAPWAFQTAPVLTLDDRLRAQVLDVLHSLHDAFARRDAQPFAQLAQTRFAEVALAFGLDPRQRVQAFVESLQRVWSRPDFAMAPIVDAEVDLRLVAGRRLVDCVDRSWRPLLRGLPQADGKPGFEAPVLLGRIDGRLSIVR